MLWISDTVYLIKLDCMRVIMIWIRGAVQKTYILSGNIRKGGGEPLWWGKNFRKFDEKIIIFECIKKTCIFVHYVR